jgi:hypothetical protein
MKKQIWSIVGAVVLLAGGFLFSGCESEDTDQDITATRFNVERELLSYDGTDVYEWNTTLSKAQFEIRVKDFRAGDALVRVFDAAGKLILSSVIVTPSYTIYVGDNEFVKIGQTASGKAGLWKVELSYNQFSGEQQVTLQ